jgi:hypothetical protein
VTNAVLPDSSMVSSYVAPEALRPMIRGFESEYQR